MMGELVIGQVWLGLPLKHNFPYLLSRSHNLQPQTHSRSSHWFE